MKDTTKKIAGVAGSALILASIGAGAAVAFAQDSTPDAEVRATGTSAQQADSIRVEAPVVRGEFSYDQTDVTPTTVITKALNDAAKYLCGSNFDTAGEQTAPSVQTIEVKGLVGHAFTATVDDLAKTGKAHVIMGCSCGGNPVDGMASINADVEGITLHSILETANVDGDANTIVFTSVDGYEVALPLSYVTQRYSLIVYNVNGGPLCDSIGGSNQLWLGSTSARYFTRDIASIALEARETPPPTPGTEVAGDTYANLPNVGVSSGGEAA